MEPTLTWIDLTTSDRDKMRRVLDLFSEQGTLDEMGLGSLRGGPAMRTRIAIAAVAVVALTISCSEDSPPPTAPTPTPSTTPPPPPAATPQSLAVSGPDSLEVGQTGQYTATVTFSDGATNRATEGVEWASGNEVVATVDNNGIVTAHQVGSFDLTARTEGLTGRKTGIRIDPPPGPATSFGSGTWIVNEDIAPGRYFTNPRSGCYWERLSGLGGTSADRITNEFIGFNSGQEIVDIDTSDRAFQTDAECGRWDMSPEAGPPSGQITPGRWLVGRQIQPGEYETNASSGCYWERLRGFSGESNDRITNDFVGDGGRVIVAIRSSDAGFYADADCGTWARR